MVIDIENLLEKINNLLATDELKAKSKALADVLSYTETESDRVNDLVERIKNIQRERSQLERALKLKMECVKTPVQRDKLFKILLKTLELQEHLNAVKYFQDERDLLAQLQSNCRSLTPKTELTKILNLLEEQEHFQGQLKSAQSAVKDFEFMLQQVWQQAGEADSQFTAQKEQQLNDRVRAIHANSKINEVNGLTATLEDYRSQISAFR